LAGAGDGPAHQLVWAAGGATCTGAGFEPPVTQLGSSAEAAEAGAGGGAALPPGFFAPHVKGFRGFAAELPPLCLTVENPPAPPGPLTTVPSGPLWNSIPKGPLKVIPPGPNVSVPGFEGEGEGAGADAGAGAGFEAPGKLKPNPDADLAGAGAGAGAGFEAPGKLKLNPGAALGWAGARAPKIPPAGGGGALGCPQLLAGGEVVLH